MMRALLRSILRPTPGRPGDGARRRGWRSSAVEALEGRALMDGGITAGSLFTMAHEVAEAQRFLRVGRFQPLLIPTFRVENSVLNPRAGRLIVQFRGAGGGGVDPASLADNVVLVRRQSPGRLPSDVTLIGQPTVLPNDFLPVNAGDPTRTPVVGVVFDFGQPLPRGNYRLLIRSGPDGVRDLAGQALDGEFTRNLPSGDGIAGGDFDAALATNGFFAYRPRPAPGPFPQGVLARLG